MSGQPMSNNPDVTHSEPHAIDVESGRVYPAHEVPQHATNFDSVLPTHQKGRAGSSSSGSSGEAGAQKKAGGKEAIEVGDVDVPNEEHTSPKGRFTTKMNGLMRFYRPVVHIALVLFGLGFWIPTLIINRDYWIPVTVIVWFFIGLIFFQYVPTRIFSQPIEKMWVAFVEKPWFSLHYYIRLAIGWLCLLGLVFGSAYGFDLVDGATYEMRTQSVFGLFVFQLACYITSKHRHAIRWRQVIVGLGMQQILAMFVLKSGAGFAIFNWIATLASDFLTQAYNGSVFFFDENVVYERFWFFSNTLAAIIFFVAFAEMMYYLGVLQWVIVKLGWFFLKTLDISGAESVASAASPFIGQGESACLVKPYVNTMTASEIHHVLASGFATIAGSVLAAYIGFGMPAVYLVTSAVMSIPASTAISKLRWPETEEPLTMGRIVMIEEEKDAQNALHAFSNGAWFGLRVAGLILANVLTIISLVAVIDGILTYIGRSWAITPENGGPLTLQLIFGYLFYPVAWLMGVPNADLLTVGQLLAVKVIQNEFVAFAQLQEIRDTMTERGFNIAVYALCGFGNVGSLGIQIGVLSALGPKRKAVIVKTAGSALICGILATCQTAGIAGQLL